MRGIESLQYCMLRPLWGFSARNLLFSSEKIDFDGMCKTASMMSGVAAGVAFRDHEQPEWSSHMPGRP